MHQACSPFCGKSHLLRLLLSQAISLPLEKRHLPSPARGNGNDNLWDNQSFTKS
jgi:hypothetical protein